MMYCYGRIVWILTRRINSKFNETESNDKIGKIQNKTGVDKFRVAKTNTIKTFFLVSISFFVCWVNNQIYFLLSNLGYEINWNGTYYQFTVLMVFLNCVVNPFIYLIKYKDYQEALMKLLRWGKHNEEQNRSTTDTQLSFVSDSQL